MAPKQYVTKMIEGGLLGAGTAKDVAKFFLSADELGISKTAVGEFLGENKPFNLEVLDAFVELQNFKHLTFEVRVGLWSFIPPPTCLPFCRRFLLPTVFSTPPSSACAS